MKPKTMIKILKDMENGRKEIQKAMEKKVSPDVLMQMRRDYLMKTIENIHYGQEYINPSGEQTHILTREENRFAISNWSEEADKKNIIAMQDFAQDVMFQYHQFLTSPASAKYHGAYDGGLFDHSMAVLEAAIKLAPAFNIQLVDIDPIPFIFHDLCKVGLYKPVTKEKTTESGKKQKFTVYEYNNDMEQIQHGPESLRRLLNVESRSDYSSFDDPLDKTTYKYTMTERYQYAIAYHMGAFDTGTDERIKFGNMCGLVPEVLWMHTADMVASKIMGL